MGLVRFLLAITVVFHHMTGFPYIGHFAVFFFFVISGFLMTSVMQNSYGYHLTGWGSFWLNRCLRLYPGYLFTLLVTLVIIFLLGETFAQNFRSSIFLPNSLRDWIQNVSMIYFSPFPQTIVPRLSPATWALTVELFFYLAISLGISKTPRRTWIWLLFSLAYSIVALVLDIGYRWSYFFIFAGSLPFAIGAAFYHHREMIKSTIDRLRLDSFKLLCIAGSITLLSYVIASRGEGLGFGSRLFFEKSALLLVNLAAISCLAGVLWNPWRPFGRSADKILGDLSYPVYISHWSAGIVAGFLLNIGSPIYGLEGLRLFAFCTFLSILFSLSITLLIDPRVEKVRTLIRGKQQHHAQ